MIAESGWGMKVGWGRVLASLGLLVGARDAAAQKAVAGKPRVTFVLELDGGLAYVFTDTGRRVDAGPVAMPAGATPASFTRHPMYLRITSGDVLEHPEWPPPEPKEKGAKEWALEGYEIWPCPDGVCPSASTLVSSPDRGPDPSHPCRPPYRTPSDLSVSAVDNLYYLPNLLALHPSADLPADWHRRLEGRVVLRAGRLVVVDTFNCVELRGATVNRRQAVTNGLSGVHYMLPATKYVDLLFKQPSSGAITRAIRVVPEKRRREIRTHLKMVRQGTNPHGPEIGESLAEYQQFYELLPGVPAGGRIDARFQPEGSQGTISPGQECGSVRLAPRPAVNAEAR
jgi:hypothetical protein